MSMAEPWVGRLIDEYSSTQSELNAYRETTVGEERKDVNAMLSNLRYGLTWMRTGHMPGLMRGIERRAIYQRTHAMIDDNLYPSLDIMPKERELTEQEKKVICHRLMLLSERERQTYILHEAYGLSLRQIGFELGITKRTAQQYFDRAREKLNL